MKRIDFSFVRTIAIGMILAFGFTGIVFANPEATVISTKGVALAKQGGKDWTELKRGDKISEGSFIKTGPKSFVRLLSPSGELVKIPAESEMAMDFSQTKSDKNANGNSYFFSELLSDGTRTRINAVRGGDPSKVDRLQGDWIAFNGLETCTPENLEAALVLAAEFQEKNVVNRSVFITWKLSGMFPTDQGLNALAGKMAGAYENKGTWRSDPVSDRAKVTQGSKVEIGYSSPDESYAYLFKTVVSASGDIKTSRLFPTSEFLSDHDETADCFFSRVPPTAPAVTGKEGVRVLSEPKSLSGVIAVLEKGRKITILERKGRYYKVKVDDKTFGYVRGTDLDQTAGQNAYGPLVTVDIENGDGQLHFWGWSSPGPTSETIAENALSQVESMLKKNKAVLDKNVLNSVLPPICGALFTLSLICG